jgi:signal peptidase
MILKLSRLARRAVGLIGVTLLVVLIGFSLLTNLAPLVGRDLFIITGGSMEPAVPIGSLVVTTPTNAMTVTVGDVITVRAESGVVVTHRVHAVLDTPAGRFFELKGDANDAPDDGLVPTGAVIGIAGLYMPYAGYARAFLSTGPGLVAAISTLVATSLAYLLLQLLAPTVRVSPPRAADPIGP